METVKYCVVIKKYNCFHGKSKSRCKECGGGAFCIHDKYKSRCKECGGGAFCIHDKHKSICRDCNGSAICIHDKYKSICRDCNGSAFCIHDKHKSICRDCGGRAICIHDKYKARCKECGGSAICIHDKQKAQCKECGGSSLCKTPLCASYKSKKFDGYCLRCFVYIHPDAPIIKNYKTKERTVVDFITEQFPQYDWINDKRIVDGCSKRRPDMLLDLGSHLVIIEIDENKHDSYTAECEIKRLNDISLDVGCRPIFMIRFNPDAYVKNGIKITSCWGINGTTKTLMIKKSKIDDWNYRLECLKNNIMQSVIIPLLEPIQIVELFY